MLYRSAHWSPRSESAAAPPCKSLELLAGVADLIASPPDNNDHARQRRYLGVFTEGDFRLNRALQFMLNQHAPNQIPFFRDTGNCSRNRHIVGPQFLFRSKLPASEMSSFLLAIAIRSTSAAVPLCALRRWMAAIIS